MWVHGYGWESSHGAWQGMLHNPMGRKQVVAEITRQRTITETETVRITEAEAESAGYWSRNLQQW